MINNIICTHVHFLSMILQIQSKSYNVLMWLQCFFQMMPDISNETLALREMPRGYYEYLRHVEPFLRNQSEDCLYLSIYAAIGNLIFLIHTFSFFKQLNVIFYVNFILRYDSLINNHCNLNDLLCTFSAFHFQTFINW